MDSFFFKQHGNALWASLFSSFFKLPTAAKVGYRSTLRLDNTPHTLMVYHNISNMRTYPESAVTVSGLDIDQSLLKLIVCHNSGSSLVVVKPLSTALKLQHFNKNTELAGRGGVFLNFYTEIFKLLVRLYYTRLC
jgi:hypothetical protein